MKRRAGTVLVLFALAAKLEAVPSQQEAPGCKTKLPLYDIFKFGVHSRGGYCETRPCEKLAAGEKYPHPPLTIHGLWPTWSNGSDGPTNCLDVAFSNNSVQFIKRDLEHFWPSFDYYVENQDMWTREVEKYGSCALCQDKNLKNGTEYVELALKLYELYNITAWLEEAGIAQSYNQTIALSRINETITKKFPDGEFELYCEGTKNKSDVLQGIRLCLSADTQAPAKCAKKSTTCTTPNVWYLGNSSSSVIPTVVIIIFTSLLALLCSSR